MNDSSALILINLGSPKSTEVADVRAYLREFLSDPLVLEMPSPLRWLLVNGIIAPFRSPKSAEAYKKIWNAQTGSPLLNYTRLMAAKLAVELPDLTVHVAMRYSEPSLRAILEQVSSCRRLYIWPLYPQFARSSTETVLVEARRVCRELSYSGEIFECRSFSERPEFIRAVSSGVAREIATFRPDHVLLSYHGLPIRQAGNYREECLATSRAITDELVRQNVWTEDKISTGFQSRLTNRWIQPFSDYFYRTLPSQGIKRLLVACPSFVADCLETLEEVAMRGREQFIEHGGEDLRLVPCLNDSPEWITAAAHIVRDTKSWQRI